MDLQIIRAKALGARRILNVLLSLLQLQRKTASVQNKQSAIHGVDAHDYHGRNSPTEAAKARWPRRLGRAASMPQALER